ncbi:MAG TPA: NifU family protein [Stenomitos sp.]
MPKIAEIEPTPNPNARKFVLRDPLTYGVSRSYDNAAAAESDALAKALFAIPHVSNVYYMDRYLTVTQDGGADWNDLLREVAVPIRAAEPAKAPETPQTAQDISQLATNPEDAARLLKINEILDKQIRPALLMDGGGLEILGLEGSELRIHYHGACGTCPSATFGTLAAIESLVRSVDPELVVVSL